MELNPYAAPLAAPGDEPPLSDVDQIRRDHIAHEASIKSLGGLYFLGGLGMAMTVVVICFVSFDGSGPVDISSLIGILIGIALSALFFWLSGDLRQLRPRARTTATVLACLGLAIIPPGTIINAYVLYLLLSAKGRMVFSERYQEIMAATPHIRYKTSPAIYILFALIVLGIIAAILFGIIA